MCAPSIASILECISNTVTPLMRKKTSQTKKEVGDMYFNSASILYLKSWQPHCNVRARRVRTHCVKLGQRHLATVYSSMCGNELAGARPHRPRAHAPPISVIPQPLRAPRALVSPSASPHTHVPSAPHPPDARPLCAPTLSAASWAAIDASRPDPPSPAIDSSSSPR